MPEPMWEDVMIGSVTATIVTPLSCMTCAVRAKSTRVVVPTETHWSSLVIGAKPIRRTVTE